MCRSDFKGRMRTLMAPGQYTDLFFLDEATALAAGHRPCGECRRADWMRFRQAWWAGQGLDALATGKEIDARLHADRWEGWGQLRSPSAVARAARPSSRRTFVANGDGAFRVLADRLLRWTPGGCADGRPRAGGGVVVLTPELTVAVGDAPVVEPSAERAAAAAGERGGPDGGHVFITRGDLRHLACDAWLCPGDSALWIEPHWGVPSPEPPTNWDLSSRALRLPATAGQPVPILTDVGGHSGMPVDWYAEGVRAFLDEAVSAVREPLNSRDRPLFALPLVGTGFGGQAEARGRMARVVLEELFAWTADHEADVVLVTFDELDFAAAQTVRRRIADERGQHAVWPALDARLRGESERLASEARAGRLVLFIGAGVGYGAGLPLWADLLDLLAKEAGLPTRDVEAMKQLSPLDQAEVIGRRLARKDTTIGAVVAEIIDGERRPSLAHTLLAGLPVREAATTNYDELFERARADAGRRIARLPYEDARQGDGWLLKMHGSVENPEDIVLTRDDYLSYGRQRAALRGLVQALLITRHMLFVGFSLTDDNFHLIVHEVHQALRGDREAPFGTALMPASDGLVPELWEGDVRVVQTGRQGEGPAAQARRLEILLDRVLALSVDNTPYLLDQSYDALLSDDERSVAEALVQLGDRLDGEASPVWDQVRAFLEDRGWRSRHGNARSAVSPRTHRSQPTPVGGGRDMAHPRREALLGRLAELGWFTQNGEVAATQAVAMLLEDAPLRQALLDRVGALTGVDVASVVGFVAEAVHADLARPDLEGRDAEGRPRVVIEAKFGASLTPSQLRAYLAFQAENSGDGPRGALVVLVPSHRRAEAEEVLGAALTPDDDPPPGPPVVAGGVLTWDELLSELDVAAEGLPDHEREPIASDLRQLRALCRTMAALDIAPLGLLATKGGGSREREDDLRRLVEQATARFRAPDGRLLPVGLEREFGFFRRYIPGGPPDPDCYCAVGVITGRAEESPPFWLRYHRDTSSFRMIADRILASHLAARAVGDGGHLWLPLPVSSTRSGAAVVEELAARIEEIRRVAAGSEEG